MSNKLNNSYEVADGVDEEVDLVDDPFVGLNISTSMNDDDDFECGYQRNDHVEGEYVNPEFLMCMGIKDQRLLKNAKKKK